MALRKRMTATYRIEVPRSPGELQRHILLLTWSGPRLANIVAGGNLEEYDTYLDTKHLSRVATTTGERLRLGFAVVCCIPRLPEPKWLRWECDGKRIYAELWDDDPSKVSMWDYISGPKQDRRKELHPFMKGT